MGDRRDGHLLFDLHLGLVGCNLEFGLDSPATSDCRAEAARRLQSPGRKNLKGDGHG